MMLCTKGRQFADWKAVLDLSLIHNPEPTRLRRRSYAVFSLKKKNRSIRKNQN